MPDPHESASTKPLVFTAHLATVTIHADRVEIERPRLARQGGHASTVVPFDEITGFIHRDPTQAASGHVYLADYADTYSWSLRQWESASTEKMAANPRAVVFTWEQRERMAEFRAALHAARRASWRSETRRERVTRAVRSLRRAFGAVSLPIAAFASVATVRTAFILPVPGAASAETVQKVTWIGAGYLLILGVLRLLDRLASWCLDQEAFSPRIRHFAYVVWCMADTAWVFLFRLAFTAAGVVGWAMVIMTVGMALTGEGFGQLLSLWPVVLLILAFKAVRT